MVGDVLDGRELVIVREEGRSAQRGEATNLGGPFGAGIGVGDGIDHGPGSG